MENKNKIKAFLGLVIILALFILSSYLVQKNIDIVKPYVKDYGAIGIGAYMVLLALEVIFIPISVIPLIPIISNSYGFFIAFIATLFGWFFGALISFGLARRFGKPLIKKLVSLNDLEKFEKLLPKNQKLFGLVLVRILVPSDALNYFFGIFTKINLSTFAITTFLGIIPITLFLVYVGNLPVIFQIIGLIMIVLFFVFLWMIVKFLGYEKLKNIIECYSLTCEVK